MASKLTAKKKSPLTRDQRDHVYVTEHVALNTLRKYERDPASVSFGARARIERGLASYVARVGGAS